MNKNLKNRLFLPVFIILVAGTITFSMRMTSQDTPMPGVVEKPYSDPTNQPPVIGEGDRPGIGSLVNGGSAMISPYYGTGGNWSLRAEAFIDHDLHDFIRWTRERYPHADPAVYSQQDILDELRIYLEFMATPAWLDWLRPTQAEATTFEFWREHWQELPGPERAHLHRAALEAKSRHLENHLDGTRVTHAGLQQRCEGLFEISEERPVTPRVRLELPVERPTLQIPRGRRASSLQSAMTWMSTNLFWTFLILSIGLGVVVGVAAKLIPLIRG